MNTFSIIAIIVVAACGGGAVFCIWRAGQILRREEDEDFRRRQSEAPSADASPED